MPKFGKGNGIPKEPVPVCGTRFPGIGNGADIVVALAGPIVAGIDSTINIRVIPKIDVSFFILHRYTIQRLSCYAWKLLENLNTLVLFKNFNEDYSIKKLQALNIYRDEFYGVAQKMHDVEFDIKSILSSLNIFYEMEGDDKKRIKNISSITNAKPDDLSFCSYEGDKAIDLISESKAGVILCKKNLRGLVHPRQGAQLIFLDKPKYVFVNLANKIFVKQKRMTGISPSAVISKAARIGDRCYIGEYTLIGDNCKIGNDTIIYDKVTLVKDCTVGDRCVIHSGVVLGDDGFAFERDERELHRFPHFGQVLIGNDVEICANSHIAKGSLSDTVICDGTKIDSLVHISHNVFVGKNCEITAGAVIGGSAKIGNSTWIGLNATLKDQIEVGENVIVASGASVIHNVPNNDIVAGVPAKSIKNKINESSDNLFLMAGQISDKKE